MCKYCYGDLCHEDYNEICMWIAANEIYFNEEQLLQIIENEVYEVNEDDDNIS